MPEPIPGADRFGSQLPLSARRHPNCSPPRRTSRRPLPPAAPRRPPAVSKRSQQQRNPSGSEIGDRRSRYGREAAPAPQHPRTRRARHRAAHAAPRTQRFACAFSGTHLRTRCLRLLVTRATGAGYAGSQSSPFPAVKPPEEIEKEHSRLEESCSPTALSPLSRRVRWWLPATSRSCRASPALLSASPPSWGRRSSP